MSSLEGMTTKWIGRLSRMLGRTDKPGNQAKCGSGVSEKRYHLHLGVHKTGTTFTQTVFRINAQKLNLAGIAYRDLAYTRKSLTPFLVGLSRRKGTVSPEKCRERILSEIHCPEFTSANRVIISDENLLGFVSDILRKNGYRNLVRRLTPIQEILGGNVRVFLTVRNYADFISSMYCELVATKPYFSFEQIRHGKFVSQLSWVKVYQDLVRVFGKENVVIFEYQTLFSNLGESLSFLAGGEIDFDYPQKEIRSSPSAMAIEFIKTESEANSCLPPRKIVENAVRKFPRNAGNPAFDPWTPEERAMLDERYRKDLEQIPSWRPETIR